MAITAPRHWRVFAPLASVLVLFGLWSAYWLWASRAAQERVVSVRAELERQGLALTCGSESLGGYPFRLTFTCNRVNATGADGSRASAERIEALAQAWDPGHIIFLVDGPLSLKRPDGALWKITHVPAVASLVIRRRDTRAALVAEHLVIDAPTGATFTAKRFDLHMHMPAESPASKAIVPSSADVAIEADTVDLAAPGLRPVRVDALETEATLSRLPLVPPWPADLRDAASAAAAAGSELTINRFTASADAVDVSASGKLEITPEGLPSGRISMQFNDIRLLFSRLAAHGVIAPKAAEAASGLVVLLTTAGTASGKPRPVDLVFKDGSIFWGPFRLASHGPLF